MRMGAGAGNPKFRNNFVSVVLCGTATIGSPLTIKDFALGTTFRIFSGVFVFSKSAFFSRHTNMFVSFVYLSDALIAYVFNLFVV